jgi:hypothetical protein
MSTRFLVGIHNSTHHRSIDDVIVSIDRNLIVENTVEVAWGGALSRKIGRLNPGTTEYVELFGIGDNFGVNDPRDVFSKAQRFVVRVSGIDTKETAAEFEFDVRATPKLRKLS